MSSSRHALAYCDDLPFQWLARALGLRLNVESPAAPQTQLSLVYVPSMGVGDRLGTLLIND
jgi:hypothetical protein